MVCQQVALLAGELFYHPLLIANAAVTVTLSQPLVELAVGIAGELALVV